MPTGFKCGLRFEVAQDVLGALLAHWSEAAAQTCGGESDLGC
jgi:hypothetical protein